ncbi:hypothetical protein [Riemerella columbipharyngis]|nr:hypothetical protein [Riemerella columbipharyngis]
MDYNISTGWNKNKNTENNQVFRYSDWKQKLNVYFYPFENHTLHFRIDDSRTKTYDSSFRNTFYDFSYQYTWSARKMDFGIECLNIANKKSYETVSVSSSDNHIERTIIGIRPRQVMFSVKFNF